MSQTLKPDKLEIGKELRFLASRSSGPGGQNVNKVNTRITLKWDVLNSQVLTVDQKEIILAKLKSRISGDGELTLVSQDSRSQLKNKEDAVEKLDELLTKAFTIRKKRKPTKPSKAAKMRRVDEKKQRSEKKEWRRKL